MKINANSSITFAGIYFREIITNLFLTFQVVACTDVGCGPDSETVSGVTDGV